MSTVLSRGFGFDADPFNVLRSLQQECNRMFAVHPVNGGIFRSGRTNFGELFAREESFPRVNVWTNADRAVISAELPGIETENLELTVHENSVTLRGKRSAPKTEENAALVKRERVEGDFNRSIELPFSVQSEGVEANFKNGLLTVTLPRAEAEKPRKISVRS